MHTSLHYLLNSGKNPKWIYYLCAAVHDAIPDAVFHSRLEKELERGKALYDESYIADRVDYYCHLSKNTILGADAPRLGDLTLRGNNSTYYYDSREVIQWFDPELHWRYLFGDIREIPQEPTIVKSRNIEKNNGNAVLLKLDKCRHFVFLKDHTPFTEKKDIAIFRGQIGTRQNRIAFIECWGGHPRVDAANTLAKGGLFATNPDGKATAPRLSLYDHLQYRYIMALEGNDVASNLKWVMSSRSLAVMPRPTCETWYMEGRLIPNVHYVEVRNDYADLLEKMNHYSTHIDEANAIADAANKWVDQFRDEHREQYIALRVMQRYLSICNNTKL